jgi:hypothetical protein
MNDVRSFNKTLIQFYSVFHMHLLHNLHNITARLSNECVCLWPGDDAEGLKHKYCSMQESVSVNISI